MEAATICYHDTLPAQKGQLCCRQPLPVKHANRYTSQEDTVQAGGSMLSRRHSNFLPEQEWCLATKTESRRTCDTLESDSTLRG